MRFCLRTLVVVLALTVTVPAFADHFTANCPLTYVGSAPPSASSSFDLSPHGVFKNGAVIYSLKGQRLLTLNVTELGDVQVVRDDLLTTLGDRDETGAVAYQNGFLFVSGESGLEIFDLRNTKPGPGGSAPLLVSRTPGLHYSRFAVSGNLLVALYPAYQLPCFASGTDLSCTNSIDIISIANLAAPGIVGRYSARNTGNVGFNDVAWANGYLWFTGLVSTGALDLTNPSSPTLAVRYSGMAGQWLTTNGTNLLGIGQETQVGVQTVGPGARLNYFAVYTLPSIVDRANPLMFHPEAFMEDSRLITMIDEKDPATLKPARTIAFDVFDFSVPLYEGFDDRIYENVSMTTPDEVKWDPITVGSFVYVNGEQSGTQVWGACGVASGVIEFDNLQGLTCGGSELHGWVTGPQRITKVELFLDSATLGTATLGSTRDDVTSATPVQTWRMPVNFDLVGRGNRVVRVVATDILGNRRQIASKVIFFNGPGQNCTNRRRAATKF